jgi:hypothetical protein
MAKETGPHSGNAGTGARVGNAGHPEQGQDTGGNGERGGTREDNAVDSPKRGPNETKPPGGRR